MKLQLKKSKIFSDFTGSLVPYYKKKSLQNFNINRFFFVYGNKKHYRANHAHKKCNQIIIPIFGKVEVEIINKKKKKKKYKLSFKNNKYLFVPNNHWIRLKFYEKNSIILTICDHKYDKKEYIQSKKEFFQIKKK